MHFQEAAERLKNSGLHFRKCRDGIIGHIATAPALMTERFWSDIQKGSGAIIREGNELLNQDIRKANPIIRHVLPFDTSEADFFISPLRLVRIDFAISEDGHPLCTEIETAPAGWGFIYSIYNAFGLDDGMSDILSPRHGGRIGGLAVDGLWWDNAQEFACFAKNHGGLSVVVLGDVPEKYKDENDRLGIKVVRYDAGELDGSTSWYRQCYEYNVRSYKKWINGFNFVNPMDIRIEYKNLLAAIYARGGEAARYIPPTYLAYKNESSGLKNHQQDIYRAILERPNERKKWVLKISGGCEESWGSRCVYFGHQFNSSAWTARMNEIITEGYPFVFQEQVKHKTYRIRAWNGGVDKEWNIDLKMRGSEFCFENAHIRFCVFARYTPEDDQLYLSKPLVHARDKTRYIHGSTDSIQIPCVIEGSFHGDTNFKMDL